MSVTPETPRLRKDQGDLDAVRALLRSMLVAGQTDEALDLVVELLAKVRDDNDALQSRLQTALRQLYGRRSEKLSPEQLALFARVFGEAPPPASPTPEGESPAPQSPGADKPAPKGARGAHGRSGPPSNLPIERTFRPVDEAQRTCAGCGSRMPGFDTESNWRVEFRPGQFVVQYEDCEKVSCPRCKDAVVTATPTGRPIASSPVGSGLLARILVDKAEDHLPIDRQRKRMAREGFEVAPSTIEGWWAQGADLLLPLDASLRNEVMRAFLVQVDATGLDVLDDKHPDGIDGRYLWAAVGERAVRFSYAKDLTVGLQKLLTERQASQDAPGGPVQGDGDTAFGRALHRNGQSLVIVGCNMHARRYFERAVKNGDLRANVAMGLYAKIYAIERQATSEQVSPEERARRRQEQIWPLLEQLRLWCLSIRDEVNPGSPLGKAIGYAERRWLSLVVFVIDGRIAPDNGEPERQIRWIAKGRDNWNYTGSDDAAKRIAIVASLCATCRRLGIDPWRYLRDVFDAIARGTPAPGIARDWTPWAWAEKHREKADAQ